VKPRRNVAPAAGATERAPENTHPGQQTRGTVVVATSGAERPQAPEAARMDLRGLS